MLDASFIEDLCCPETRQPLRLADPTLVARLNEAIAAERLQNRIGGVIKEPLEAGLLRADGQYLYPVRSQMPILLLDEAIKVGG